jgi:Ca2+-binding RTX toxin-like protein
MFTHRKHTDRKTAGRRPIMAAAFTGTLLAATLGLATDSAMASYSPSVQAGTLQITGNGASDKLALRLAPGAPNTLQVDVGADGTADFSFDRSTFTAIRVDARGGDDSVVIDQSGGAFTDETVIIEGGGGADVLSGGDGDDVLVGGDGNDTVDGGRGADTALLGNGADHFIWDPGEGSDIVEGQGGNDALDFNGSNAAEDFDVSANGSRVRFFRNVGAITMDLDGIEAVNVKALGGADKLTLNDLTGTDLTRANVDLNATGGGDDGSADTVIANGTTGADKVRVSSAANDVVVSGLAAQVQVAGSAPGDNVEAAPLGGADEITAGVGIASPGGVIVDGGEGSDTLDFDGAGSPDTIGVALNAAAVRTFGQAGAPVDSTAVENLTVHGRGGEDTITGSNGIALLTHLTIDGGDGADVLRGGDGDDVLIGGNGNDTVAGARGIDVAFLGNGRDHFVWDPGDGSDTVEGQAGNDVLDFDGSNAPEDMDVSANGSRVRFFRNVGAITMDLDGVEALNVKALGGADKVTVNDLTGTDLKRADVDLRATGGGDDGSADTVITNATSGADKVRVSQRLGLVRVRGLAARTTIAGSTPDDALQINTLAGKDDVSVAADVSGLITPSVDLGIDE